MAAAISSSVTGGAVEGRWLAIALTQTCLGVSKGQGDIRFAAGEGEAAAAGFAALASPPFTTAAPGLPAREVDGVPFVGELMRSLSLFLLVPSLISPSLPDPAPVPAAERLFEISLSFEASTGDLTLDEFCGALGAGAPAVVVDGAVPGLSGWERRCSFFCFLRVGSCPPVSEMYSDPGRLRFVFLAESVGFGRPDGVVVPFVGDSDGDRTPDLESGFSVETLVSSSLLAASSLRAASASDSSVEVYSRLVFVNR